MFDLIFTLTYAGIIFAVCGITVNKILCYWAKRNGYDWNGSEDDEYYY